MEVLSMSWLERIDEREARRIGKAIAAGAMETRDLAGDHLTQFAQQARAVAEPRIHEAADFIRHEGTAVAKLAAHQAARASRAVKADPLPTIVGIVGVALLASLFLGRRRT
jgi:ElaB/YqjD/DUF883 family membrane-anchored ribosome-binding protein